MSGLRVQIDAAKTDRSLVGNAPVRRPQKANPVLKLWRWMINAAVADAKRTKYGMPTDLAIMARHWLEENQPLQSDKENWETSFECACNWLDLNVIDERKRLLEEIDAALHVQLMEYFRAVVYQRKAAVLTCAGIYRAIGKQYQLPLVAEDQYEMVAGIDHPEPERVTKQLAQRDRKRAA